MHVGDEVIVRVAEVIRRSLAPRMLAARISGDRFARVRSPTSALDAAQTVAESLRDGLERLGFVAGRRRPVEVSASFGVAQRRGRQASARRTRSPPPRSPARPPRTAAATASRSTRTPTRASCAATPTSRSSARCATRWPRTASGSRRRPIVPLNGALRRAELRAAAAHDRTRPARASRPTSSSRPRSATSSRRRSTAGSCGGCCETLQAARGGAGSAAAPASPSTSPASRSATRTSARSSRARCARAACRRRCSSFELTETAAVANIVRAEALMRRLRELGCDVALDDFGRGLSSLTYLKTLPVTCLKIDGSFVRDVVGDERSQAMLSAIVRLAQAMGLETVAECVESDEIRAIARQLGVDFGQGFSIGRPLPLEQVIPVAARRYHLRPSLQPRPPVPKGIHTLLAVAAGALLGAGLMLVRGVSAGRERRGRRPPRCTAAAPSLLDEVRERVRREYVDARQRRPARPGRRRRHGREPRSALRVPRRRRVRGDAREHRGPLLRRRASRSRSRTAASWSSRRSRARRPTAPACARRRDARDRRPGRRRRRSSTRRSSACAASSGSTVRLAVARDGEPEPLQFALERSEVHVRTVRAEPLPGAYGYVRITHFNDATPRDSTGGCRELQAAAPLAGLVLDLRGNPGGVLESAVSVADDFLETGVIVRAEGRTAGVALRDARHRRRPAAQRPARGAGGPRLGLRRRDRRRGAARPRPRDADGRAHLRQGIGADRDAAARRPGAQAHDLALLHAVGRLDPRSRHRAGRAARRRCCVRGPSPRPSGAANPAVQAALQYLRDRSLGTQVALAGGQ